MSGRNHWSLSGTDFGRSHGRSPTTPLEGPRGRATIGDAPFRENSPAPTCAGRDARYFDSCLAVLLAPSRDESPTRTAVKLVNQGDVEGAMRVLREQLDRNAKDTSARIVLGQILDFDGRPDEAVALWEKGLTGGPSDLNLLMSIGQIRHRQGTDGPTIERRRGTIGAKPSKDEAAETAYKAEHLARAAAAFEKSQKIRPGDPKIGAELASVYTEQKKYDEAAKVWESLIKADPKNADYHLNLALTSRSAGRKGEAERHLQRTIELNKRLATAHEALAEIQKEEGRAAEAEMSQKRAGFYGRLPEFAALDFSEPNLRTLDGLNQKATVSRLAGDPSEEATQFLAVLCWSHPHNRLETQAFQALEDRGPKTTPLLRSMLDDARSTCTIRSAGHILARRKADGLFDLLVERLPGDLRGFGMEMDIAGSLDDLGDPRAVAPLVQFLNPRDPDAGTEEGLMSDRKTAQARAALALGAFDTPEAKAALDAALRDAPAGAVCGLAAPRKTLEGVGSSGWSRGRPRRRPSGPPSVGDYLG